MSNNFKSGTQTLCPIIHFDTISSSPHRFKLTSVVTAWALIHMAYCIEDTYEAKHECTVINAKTFDDVLIFPQLCRRGKLNHVEIVNGGTKKKTGTKDEQYTTSRWFGFPFSELVTLILIPRRSHHLTIRSDQVYSKVLQEALTCRQEWYYFV